MIIVADSGPIISFARAGRLDLLKQVTTELIISDAVFEEIVVSGDDRPGAEEVKQGLWIKRATVQDRSLLENMAGKLSRGESEAIVLAKELDAYLLVDELEARKEASRLGINYFGSLRIIKEAKERGVISKAKAVLDDLIASSTYLDDTLYQRFLREMGEEEEEVSPK
jgi:predicted nucleic acid-binding protein